MRRLQNSSTHSVIKELGMVFTEFGRPFILRSDNGPCYTSKEFHKFLDFYKVHHIMSSPHHPRSNGFAKALMGTVKKLIDKVIKDGKPWNYGLFQYRVTPISGTIPSLLEALTRRKLRTSLPQVPPTIRRTVDGSRICQELIRGNLMLQLNMVWIWNQDNQCSSKKCKETSGRQLPLINLPKNQILIG